MKRSVSPRSLNTDDNKLSLGPDESKFSLNIDAEGFGEDEAGVVKHVRGNSSASFSDESIQLPVGDNKVVGSVADEQLNVVYFFVHNSLDQHSIVAYNSKTNTYRTVFISSELDFSADNFVKADIVRLRRVPDDIPLNVIPPDPPQTVTPVALKFFVEIDLSPWGESQGYKSTDFAPAITNSLQVRFASEGGTRIYDGPEIVYEDTISGSSIDIAFRTQDTLSRGWLKFGTFTVHVHPDDVFDTTRTLKYKIAQNLGGPVNADVFRPISNNVMIMASDNPVNGAGLGRKCYGFNKNIEEMMVSDLYSGAQLAIQSVTTSTGRLRDRKVSVNFGCNYSQTEAWDEALLAEVSEYADGLVGSIGGSGFRSHPAERMDNGGGGPSVGPGGGGGGESITLTYCSNNWPANGADFQSATDAIQAYYDNYQGLQVDIVNTCPVLEGFGDLTLEPVIFVHDPVEGITSFSSSTPVEFDPFLQTIPEEYDFEIEVYASSCGTMRRESAVVFGGAGIEGETSVEFLPPSAQSGYGIFWTSQNNLGPLEFGDVVSDIEHKPILFEELIDNNTGNVPEVTMRSFEISVGLGFGEGQITSSSVVLEDGGFKAFLQEAGNPYPTSVTYLCYGSNNTCSGTAGLPTEPRELIVPEVPEVIEDQVVVPDVPTDVDTTEDTTTDEPTTTTPTTTTSTNTNSTINKAKIVQNQSKISKGGSRDGNIPENQARR